MKIRSGFVSNSSSSSFIAGIGRIKDVDSFTDMFKKIKEDWNGYSIQILSTSDILEGSNDFCISVRQDGKQVFVTAPVNTEQEVSVAFDPGNDEKYFSVEIGNDEGDSEFWDPLHEEMDYSMVDEDWFTGSQAEIIKILQNAELFEEVEFVVGAARNG